MYGQHPLSSVPSPKPSDLWTWFHTEFWIACLRMLLVVGALSVIRRAKQVGYTRRLWLTKLLRRRSTKIAAIALANKIARIAWAMMARNEKFEPSRLIPV